MEQNWLRCSASPGQFPTELAVSGVQFNGHGFSLFAPEESVKGLETDGTAYIKVDVVDRRGSLALVRLPAQTFENGQHIPVNATDLHTGHPAQRLGA